VTELLSFEAALELADRLDPELLRIIDASSRWAPLPGPQTDAWQSEADELFYGGAAGGGKTDFVCGLALEEHIVSIIYRREAPQLSGITDRLSDLLGGRDLFHGGDKVWRPGGGRQIEYGSMPNSGDEQKYQGRPHDLIVFDEITQFTEWMFRYLQTWNRPASHVPRTQRCRVVATGNPPTTPEGLWVTQYWGPWLDPSHELFGKVRPGELVWYVTIEGVDTIVPDGGPYLVPGTDRVVLPRSRTFIPAKVEENPFLMEAGYADTLEGLPEPLRSQMREGNFLVGQTDHAWQCIPSAWVDAAQARWRMRRDENKGPMHALGVDPARGGGDNMVLAPRYGTFFDELVIVPGKAIPDGPAGAALCVQHMRNGCVLNVDVVGVGTSVVDHLEGLGLEVNSLHGAAGSRLRDKTGKLGMVNLRAAMYWNLREMLDPTNPDPIALPPSSSLKADLCAPHYEVKPGGIQVESKERLMSPTRLGRSPDEGDAVVYAAWQMQSMGNLSGAAQSGVDPTEYGGYKRPASATAPQGRPTHGWGNWGGTINYPED